MRRLFLFLMAVFASITFVACSQDDDVVYSCDKSVDSWVKEHLPEIRSMTRSEWMELPASVDRAAYVAFTPEQKLAFWRDKFAEVLAMSSWSEAEVAHIRKAANFIETHVDIFADGGLTSSEEDELDTFFYKWKKYGQEQLGWDKEVAYYIAASGLPMPERGNDGNVTPTTKGSDHFEVYDPTSSSCDCNLNHDFCWGSSMSGSCHNSDCDDSTIGCGWVWLQDCNGECDPM